MKSILSMLVVAVLLGGVAQAQEKCKVEGVVTDQAGRYIDNVAIKISSSLGTFQGKTDRNGRYSVTTLCTETSKHTVAVSKTGYIFNPATRPWEKYYGGPSFTGRTEGEPVQKPGTVSPRPGQKR